MPGWKGSNRKSRLPADWPKIRKRIQRRDRGLCQWRMPDGRRCLMPASDVDHIVPGDDHRDSNLRCLCSDHHRRKSSQEGAAALRTKRRQIAERFKREEPHPGEIEEDE